MIFLDRFGRLWPVLATLCRPLLALTNFDHYGFHNSITFITIFKHDSPKIQFRELAPLDVGAVCLVDDYYPLIRDTFGGDFRLTRLSEIVNWRLLGRTETTRLQESLMTTCWAD